MFVALTVEGFSKTMSKPPRSPRSGWGPAAKGLTAAAAAAAVAATAHKASQYVYEHPELRNAPKVCQIANRKEAQDLAGQLVFHTSPPRGNDVYIYDLGREQLSFNGNASRAPTGRATLVLKRSGEYTSEMIWLNSTTDAEAPFRDARSPPTQQQNSRPPSVSRRHSI